MYFITVIKDKIKKIKNPEKTKTKSNLQYESQNRRFTFWTIKE